jgi:hypothetical protein
VGVTWPRCRRGKIAAQHGFDISGGRGRGKTPFKIGKANNVARRLAQLQTSTFCGGGMSGTTFVKLLLIEYRAVPRAEVLSIELRIHKTLAGYRMKGEWFSCDLATAKAAIDSVVPV